MSRGLVGQVQMRGVNEFDWPTIKPDIEAGSLSDTDPIPVPEFDLGQAAAGRLTGAASTALHWDQIDDDTFERLLYDLLREFPEHENVTWLTKTRAPDRGRDLALDRILQDGTGCVRRERVINRISPNYLTHSSPDTMVSAGSRPNT
ncbi:hypothetical protein [Nocardia sp. NPDC050718]|uniref:hypothetical protein n=1 Tax=Nocardia sp. NPDC050718 TaxID=3155788 RepID=UPI0033CE5718